MVTAKQLHSTDKTVSTHWVYAVPHVDCMLYFFAWILQLHMPKGPIASLVQRRAQSCLAGCTAITAQSTEFFLLCGFHIGILITTSKQS